MSHSLSRRGMVWPLLGVYLLTALATAATHLLQPARELRAFGLLLDVVPFAGVIAATGITAARLRARSLPSARVVVSICSYLAGALVGTLGVAHSTAVVMLAVARVQESPFDYTFRFYSLLLLGGLFIAAGLVAATKTEGLARGRCSAWRAAVSLWCGVLAINLPLVPLQRFAIAFSVIAAIALLLLAGVRRQFDPT